MLIPARPAVRSRSIMPPRLSSANTTIGGQIDSDAKADTVVPDGAPSTQVVMTVTGAVTRAMASRNACSSSSTAQP